MAAPLKSVESSSAYSINQDGQDGLDAFTDLEQLEQAKAAYNQAKQRFDLAPTTAQLFGAFDIFCLVMNRTIGSGIFTVPPKVLSGTGSVGASLLLWLAGGIIILCAVLSWLELGLTIPMHTVYENGVPRKRSAPRNGGEKNYLEYIYKKPAFLMTSMFGIMFIVLGNLAGNAVAFGIYFMIVLGKDPIDSSENNYQKVPVIGLAISVMTICCLFHALSRRGGIVINNAFAVAKVGILVVIAILGFVHAGGKYLRSSGINEQPPVIASTVPALNITSTTINNALWDNFNKNTSFKSTGSVSSFVQSLLFAIYPFTGFEQPFYVLSEVARPKKVFPKAAITAMLTTIVLYMLVNISYFCVIPKESYTEVTGTTIDMATAFFHDLFGPGAAPRAMAGLVAFSIFGNILVLTFTAARVKQEIAKEGILPFSLFFATGKITPWARFRNRSKHVAFDQLDLENHLEETPMAALALHWFSSIFMILITAMLKPSVAYSFLVTLYSYVNVAVLGLLTGGGLLYLKVDSWTRGKKGRDWSNKTQWTPWLDPLPAVIYAFAMAFLLFASFVKPAANSAFSDKVNEYGSFLVPAIGLSSLLWGVVWWFGLEVGQYRGRYRVEITRTPFLERDSDGNYVQKVELVEHGKSWRRPGNAENTSKA